MTNIMYVYFHIEETMCGTMIMYNVMLLTSKLLQGRVIGRVRNKRRQENYQMSNAEGKLLIQSLFLFNLIEMNI